jgi:hypothetical protein
MKTLLRSAIVALALAVIASAGATRAGAGSLCVGSKPGCYATIQAALDAAPDGATIKLLAGTFTGGLTIQKDVRLSGAGAGSTVISGGGPVVTVGAAGVAAELTVSISGVTITGGINTAGLALGGGVYVPASSGGLAATVTISDSVITGNRAAPSAVGPGCGDHPFAGASGGGIDNAGTMTLTNVSVTANQATSDLASDAEGGGITNEFGAILTVRHSIVSGNLARVTTPNGRFAEGGGIFTRKGSTLTVEDSRVDANTVDYTTSVPSNDHCSGFAQAGGIKIGGDETTNVTIHDSSVSQNTVTATSPTVDVIAFAGGIDNDGTLALDESTLDGNRVTATGTDASVDGGAIEIEGPTTIADTRLTGNAVTATALTGTALAQGGAILTAADQLVTLSESIVSGNLANSTSSTQAASVEGAGILNAGLLELRGTQVSENLGSATGSSGTAQGGGIWNSQLPDGPPVQLTLRDSSVTRNALSASPGSVIQGGGLYTTFPVTLTSSAITKNTPDDCFGC